MEYILIVREGFKNEIDKNMLELEKLNIQGLILAYNRQVEIGIIGSYTQAVFIAALRLAFLKITGKSPITLEEGIVIKLNGHIKIENDKLVYLNSTPII